MTLVLPADGAIAEKSARLAVDAPARRECFEAAPPSEEDLRRVALQGDDAELVRADHPLQPQSSGLSARTRHTSGNALASSPR